MPSPRYLAPFAGETSLTTGTGPYTLEGVAGTGWRAFLTAFANLEAPRFIARNRPGTKWEEFYGVVTDDSPKDTLTRNFIASSTGALIDWQTEDTSGADGPVYIYAMATASLLDSLLQNHRGAARPAWLKANAFWIADGAGATARKWYFFDGADDILVGTIDETNDKFFPSPHFNDAVNEVKGADIASASTIDLDAATGNLVDVTGTTAITAITLSEGRERTIRTTGILTLTHGSSLVLPGAANIATAAGDFFTFRGYSGGVVRCVHARRADGRPLFQRRGADIASATTTVLDNATGDIVDVTGTATITAITLADGREQQVRAAGAFTLTHGASLALPGGANIVAAAGDTMTFRGYAGGVVRCVHYQRASGQAVAGLGAWTESYVTTVPSTITAAIPDDDTIPQISEGTEIANVSGIVVAAGQKVEIDWQAHASATSNAVSPVVAIFRSGTNDALEAAFISLYNTNTLQFMAKGLFVDAPSAGTYTYSIRIGPLGAGTLAVNGFNGTTTRKLGGALRSGLRVRVLG